MDERNRDILIGLGVIFIGVGLGLSFLATFLAIKERGPHDDCLQFFRLSMEQQIKFHTKFSRMLHLCDFNHSFQILVNSRDDLNFLHDKLQAYGSGRWSDNNSSSVEDFNNLKTLINNFNSCFLHFDHFLHLYNDLDPSQKAYFRCFLSRHYRISLDELVEIVKLVKKQMPEIEDSVRKMEFHFLIKKLKPY